MILSEKIQLAAEWIHSAEYVVAFTGAGISTASGIPDFRSPASGMWKTVNPMQVASLFGFRQNPKAFYDWVRPLAVKTIEAKPNAAHYALVKLEQYGKMRAVITQNIDMLHTRAGSSTVMELHGHMREATCISCFEVYDGQAVIAKFVKDGDVPICAKCGGTLKPNVILYGEQLPMMAFKKAQQAARECDLMLVVGSSLEVAPASDIPLLAKRTNAKVVIINMESTILDKEADIVIRGDAAELLPALVKSVETAT